MPSNRYSITVTGLTSTFGDALYFPDTAIRPFALGIGCVVNSSNVTYDVEHTFDYTGSSAFNSSAATWFDNTGISAQSTNANGNYAFPVSGVRLNVTAGSSTGTVTMTIIQAG